MVQVTLEQAEAHLSDLIDQVRSGQDVEIVKNGEPVVKVSKIDDNVKEPTKPSGRRQLGLMKGVTTYIADDFDAPLDDLKEYM